MLVLATLMQISKTPVEFKSINVMKIYLKTPCCQDLVFCVLAVQYLCCLLKVHDAQMQV